VPPELKSLVNNISNQGMREKLGKKYKVVSGGEKVDKMTEKKDTCGSP
tara:strand:- start:10 stop:153 length:144 start_codon:yes stop_codon:yes gene_type:complete